MKGTPLTAQTLADHMGRLRSKLDAERLGQLDEIRAVQRENSQLREMLQNMSGKVNELQESLERKQRGEREQLGGMEVKDMHSRVGTVESRIKEWAQRLSTLEEKHKAVMSQEQVRL